MFINVNFGEVHPSKLFFFCNIVYVLSKMIPKIMQSMDYSKSCIT
jgi:hypothetical protein